jgi:EAL domain-containing protein (putative c-di-GMP-specific phosphodiesterase class I)
VAQGPAQSQSTSKGGFGAELCPLSERLPFIGERLAAIGAMGVVVIDLSPLEGIEWDYGPAAYERVLLHVHSLLQDILSAHRRPGDTEVTTQPESNEVVCFLFRHRGDVAFYQRELPGLQSALARRLHSRGAKLVHPYRPAAMPLATGQSIALHDATVSDAVQVRRALDRARVDGDLYARVTQQQRWRELMHLVFTEEVTMNYQPIAELSGLHVIGYEALVRGPDGSEFHSPTDLFHAAAQVDLQSELDSLCRRKALLEAKSLPTDAKLFLNCLPTAMRDPSFGGDAVRRTLEDCGLTPSEIVLEISERHAIENFSIFREARDYYGGLGFKIALDDTGAGYASLRAVMELAPDFIKLDSAFVASIDADQPRQALVQSLAVASRKLGAKIIAEGIETQDELATLRSLGIPLGQGFLLGRPKLGFAEGDPTGTS